MPSTPDVVEFYPHKVQRCHCLQLFFDRIYTEDCLRSLLEIWEALDHEPSFNGIVFFGLPLKRNYIIVCKVFLGHFLLKEECSCEWVDGDGEWFGRRRFCNKCINIHLREISKTWPFKIYNE